MPVKEVETKDPLSQGSMIERIGSYKPPRRPGYAVNRQELKLQDNVAKKLYNKRVKLARHMSLNPSGDIKEIVYSALVANGISPHSVVKFEDYIELLVQRQGGIKRWKSQVDDEVTRLKEAQIAIFYSFLPVFILLVSSLIAGIIGSEFFSGAKYYVFIPGTLAIAAFAYAVNFTRKDAIKNKEIISQLAGSRRKQVEQFVSHRDI